MSTKRTVWSEHGKVHQTWMCYTNLFMFIETWAGFEVSHSIWLCHCPQMVWRCRRSSNTKGENYLFITPVALTYSLSFLSPQAVWGVHGPACRPLAPGIHTFQTLCTMVFNQHSSRLSVWCGCKLLLATSLTLNFDLCLLEAWSAWIQR